MAGRIRLCVVTAEETVLDRQVDYVNIPTEFGSVGVLRGHAPMLCAVGKGVLRCTDGEESIRVALGEGVACVENDELTILVSEAKKIDEQ